MNIDYKNIIEGVVTAIVAFWFAFGILIPGKYPGLIHDVVWLIENEPTSGETYAMVSLAAITTVILFGSIFVGITCIISLFDKETWGLKKYHSKYKK